MRYLLLSVLVVCMVGVMIPSAFGQVGPGYDGSVTAYGFDLILIFLIVVPVALVIIIVIAIKIMRKMK